jgi:hypothetical protein
MAKKQERPAQHPDDLIVVGLSLAFQAKLNPEADNPQPLEATQIEETFSAADAADHLEKVVRAIRERRLYGFMLQEQAESAVGAGDWVEKTIEEIIAEARTENNERSSNVPIVETRHDD